MKKIILMMVLTISLFAIDTKDVSNAGFANLTTQEQADVLKLIADKQVKKSNLPDLATAKEAQEWVNLGSSIGKGLASSAKELGVQVNEFSKSDVGKLTMFLIVFQIMGDKVISLFGGFIFITLGFIFTTMLLNRFSSWEETHKDGKLIKRERTRTPGGDLSAFWFGYGAVMLTGTLIMVVG